MTVEKKVVQEVLKAEAYRYGVVVTNYNQRILLKRLTKCATSQKKYRYGKAKIIDDTRSARLAFCRHPIAVGDCADVDEVVGVIWVALDSQRLNSPVQPVDRRL